MAAVAFDTLAFVRRVVAAGVPREQAEAQAEAMKDAFENNMDILVTREYLNRRFIECESRIDQKISELRQDIRGDIDGLRGGIMDLRGEFGELRGMLNLHSWMLGLLLITTAVPALLKFLA